MDSHSSMEMEVPEDILNAHDHANRYQYACDNGGTLYHTITAGVHENTDKTFSWNNCLDGEITKGGTLNSWTYEYGSYYRDLITSLYTADYANGNSVELAGRYGEIVASYINPTIRRMDGWIHSGFDYTLRNESVELDIRNVGTRTDFTWS